MHYLKENTCMYGSLRLLLNVYFCKNHAQLMPPETGVVWSGADPVLRTKRGVWLLSDYSHEK